MLDTAEFAEIRKLLEKQEEHLGLRLDRIEDGQAEQSGKLDQVNVHLAEQNGNVAYLTKRDRAHSEMLKDHGGKIAELMASTRAMETADRYHDTRIDEARDERRELWAKVWEVTKTVAEIGAIAVVVAKAAGVW